MYVEIPRSSESFIRNLSPLLKDGRLRKVEWLVYTDDVTRLDQSRNRQRFLAEADQDDHMTGVRKTFTNP
ncbi:hypothetical protein RRG08_050311 [Elysia crispata]|uniref:Uncharacterized protein n=1 Tax=Elysia crispata TaxID=231223 RepID=A0AAE0ZYA1_9GAST|nr:hypothetical protein RRG08_050311 [Elysia crispata]